MSVLSSLESMIAGLIEGTFSRVFRSEVRPVEIARKLSREMDEHRAQSLSRTIVPNEYRVYLSPRDHERFIDYEDALAGELAAYLLEHARRERYALLSQPVIEFETDERLRLGEFGIQTRVVTPEDEPHPQPAGAESGHTMVYGAPAGPAAPAIEDAPPPRLRRALLLYDGRRLLVSPTGAAIGRSRQCDVVISDPNVSRQHAEVTPQDGAWVLSDLSSTNGSRLNGRRITHPEVLQPGDEIEIGTSVITFELE